jgi:hypothetical protein
MYKKMSINRFLKYSVYIFNLLTIILMLISFYCLFIQFLDLFLYQDVCDFVVHNVSDTYTKDEYNMRDDNRDDTTSLCSCSSCTCSNPSINVSSGIFTLIDKYKNVGKRRIYWFLCEKGKSNFSSYDKFKTTWNPNTQILNEVKKKFMMDKEKILLKKRTLTWFFKGSKPGGGRGL